MLEITKSNNSNKKILKNISSHIKISSIVNSEKAKQAKELKCYYELKKKTLTNTVKEELVIKKRHFGENAASRIRIKLIKGTLP